MLMNAVMRSPIAKDVRTKPVVAPETTASFLTACLLELHSAVGLHDLWRALRKAAQDHLHVSATILEVEPRWRGKRVWRRADPATASSPLYQPSGRNWLEENSGRPIHRSPIENGGRGADVISLLSWRGREFQGALSFEKEAKGPGFTSREAQIIASLQPYFHAALGRVLACEDEVFRAGQITSILRDFPIGLLVLGWDLQPVWYNEEAALACAIWNHGERQAAALNPKQDFQLPAALESICGKLRNEWDSPENLPHKSPLRTAMLSHPAAGLHAQIAVGRSASDAQRTAFQIQIDYRRPRGDRNRAVSAGALSLLARLTTREREVAMKIREGQRTAEIARDFHRSPLTIKTQLNSVFKKLGVRNRAQVAALLNR